MNKPSPIPDFFLKQSVKNKKLDLLKRNKKALILFLASAAYGLFLLFFLNTESSGEQDLMPIALYAYGLIGGLGLLLLNQFYTDVDRSRRILTEVLEKSAEARAITDSDGNTIYSNFRFNRLVEGQENQSIASFTELFDKPEEIKEKLNELLFQASPAGSSTADIQKSTTDKTLWFQVTCQHIIGWPGFVHWRFDDISHRHKMEDTIQEERRKLKDFTDNAPVGFFSINEKGEFLFANNTMLKLLGIEDNILIKQYTLHDFLVVPPINAHPYDCFEEGHFHQQGNLLMKSVEGKEFNAAITHSITAPSKGRIISRSIVHDLTNEQKIQQALEESEDRFQRLFEEAPVGICILNEEGIISDANHALSSMFKQSINNINGKPLIHNIKKEAHDLVKTWLYNLSQGHETDSFIEVPLKGSFDVTAQLYARKLQSSNNLVLHFIDLTEQKNLEKQFTQSQKMQAVGQLAGGIAHDFNNLLTAMIGFCDLLLLRHKPGDTSFADIMQIKQNANRAANLVRQLLAFSRQQTLQPRVLDLTDLLTELSHLIRRLIGVNIDLQISHDHDLGLIKADHGQMEQVLINLAVNARDAMPQGGKLIIRTENFSNDRKIKLVNDEFLPDGNWVSIIIEDTGTGIDPENLPRVFEPFFSTKEVGAGTGLGLATVHGIIHQTGGYITIDSNLGKGTTFTIYLPRHTKEIETEKTEIVEEKQTIKDLTGTAKILLVEDEDAVRIFSSRALSNKGYQVLDAASGKAALHLLEEKKIDPEILITDVMMPEMDGTMLAKIVREKYPHVKIIFISGYAEDKFKEHLGSNVWFLPKPFTLKQLASKVKEVLEEDS